MTINFNAFMLRRVFSNESNAAYVNENKKPRMSMGVVKELKEYGVNRKLRRQSVVANVNQKLQTSDRGALTNSHCTKE
jgi:hypothetical protein